VVLLGCLCPGAKSSWQSGRAAPGDGWWRWVLDPLFQIHIHTFVSRTDRVTLTVSTRTHMIYTHTRTHTHTHTDCSINKTFGVIDGIASKPQLKNKQRNHKNTSRNVLKWKWKWEKYAGLQSQPKLKLKWNQIVLCGKTHNNECNKT